MKSQLFQALLDHIGQIFELQRLNHEFNSKQKSSKVPGAFALNFQEIKFVQNYSQITSSNCLIGSTQSIIQIHLNITRAARLSNSN